MDRENNLIGNTLGRMRGHPIDLLKAAPLVYVENGVLVRRRFSNPEELEKLRPFVPAWAIGETDEGNQ